MLFVGVDGLDVESQAKVNTDDIMYVILFAYLGLMVKLT